MSNSNRDRIRATIDESPLFKHLSDEWRERLTDDSHLETYESGDTIIQEGQEEQHHLFIVLDGQARVWTRSPKREVELKTLRTGAYFGEVSLLSDNMATATVEPNSDELTVVAIDRKTLLKLLEDDEKVREMLEGVTLARAKDTIAKVME